MAEKIAVAMSGGVDSSVSAFLLKKSGFNVVGVTFLLFESKNFKVALSDAKKVSDSIGIEHIIVDLRKEFRNEVINYFISEYLSGRTPNPCIMCNKNIKFGLAMTKLLNMGFSKIATGHYSQIIKQNERFAVKKKP